MSDPGTVARSQADPSPAAEHRRFIASLGIVAALGLWIPQLTSSLWADETVTHWIIRGSLHQTVARAARFEGESPLYFILVNGWRHLAGTSELAMRIPSLLAITGAAVLVWRIGRRLVDDEAGILAALIFIASPGITFAAGDARPYPVAIFMVVAATLILLRWSKRPSPRDALAYVIVSTLALYFHYFSALALAAHPLYIWISGRRTLLHKYALMLGGVIVLMIPAVPHIVSLVHRRHSLQVAIGVNVTDYFAVIVPPLLIGSIALGAVAARAWGSRDVQIRRLDEGAAALAIAWWIVPPTALYLITRTSSTTLFEPRFFFFAIPGLALVVGSAVGAVGSSRARSVIAVAIAIGAFWGFSSKTHSGDKWREAAARERSVANAATVVLFRPNFIESAQIDWLRQPDKRPYLLSETSPYPMTGRIVLIPYALTPAAQRYLDPVVEQVRTVARFILVNDRGGFRPWLEGRLPGFSAREFDDGGLVSVVVFQRKSG